jgi:hypothetical protein
LEPNVISKHFFQSKDINLISGAATMVTRAVHLFYSLQIVTPQDIADAARAGFSEREIAYMFLLDRRDVRRLRSLVYERLRDDSLSQLQ